MQGRQAIQKRAFLLPAECPQRMVGLRSMTHVHGTGTRIRGYEPWPTDGVQRLLEVIERFVDPLYVIALR